MEKQTGRRKKRTHSHTYKQNIKTEPKTEGFQLYSKEKYTLESIPDALRQSRKDVTQKDEGDKERENTEEGRDRGERACEGRS